MPQQQSSRYVVCPHCLRTLNPERYLEAGLSVFDNNESIDTVCLGCDKPFNIKTKVIHSWTTTVPDDDSFAPKLRDVEQRILDHLRVTPLYAGDHDLVGSSYGSLKVHISRLRKAGFDIINVDSRPVGILGRGLGTYQLIGARVPNGS